MNIKSGMNRKREWIELNESHGGVVGAWKHRQNCVRHQWISTLPLIHSFSFNILSFCPHIPIGKSWFRSLLFSIDIVSPLASCISCQGDYTAFVLPLQVPPLASTGASAISRGWLLLRRPPTTELWWTSEEVSASSTNNRLRALRVGLMLPHIGPEEMMCRSRDRLSKIWTVRLIDIDTDGRPCWTTWPA